MDELTSRVAVLEHIAADTRDTLLAIRGDLAALQRDVSRTREEMARADDLGALRQEVAGLRENMAHAGDVTTLRQEVAGIRENMARAGDLATLRQEVTGLREDVARLDGRVYGLPTTWQMLTAVMVGPGVVMALLLTMFRLFGGH